MKSIILSTLIFIIGFNLAHAQLTFEGNYPPNQPIEEYFAAENPQNNRSIIYLFYNNDTFCYQCPQTMELTQQIFNQYYNGMYDFYVLNYQQDNEYDYSTAYKLTEQIAIVLVKNENGQTQGYIKLSDPQNMLSSGQDFTNYLTEQINNYLGN